MPRHLSAIVLLAFLSLATLAWFGWNLLAQDRAVEAQRVQERLQQEADRIAASLRESLAVIGERLGEWVATPPDAAALPDGSLLLVFSPGAVQVYPPGSLLYTPSLPSEVDLITGLFAVGESLELSSGQAGQAAAWYGRLARTGDPAIRAGALLRLGRVLRRSGRIEAACAAYRSLIELAGARAAGVPAELVGRHALCDLCGAGNELEPLRRDLLSGRWRLTRGQFAFYWSEIGRLRGREETPPARARSLAEAAAQSWEAWRGEPTPRGQQTILTEGRPWVLLWRGSEGRQAALIAEPEQILQRAAGATKLLCAIVDGEGHAIAGRRGDSVRAAVRTAAEARLPWTLYVSTPPEWDDGGSRERQRFVVGVLAVMTLFLVAGTYFIARAIRKEALVARRQSDFVATVSHEFRSPLTSMRQLSELLALGRVPSEDRRQKYYDTLVGETRRLQGLVETLLNFGKMEAGGRQYRFEELSAGGLVERVVGEFEGQLAGSGRRIEMHGAAAEATIEADPEAIALALRNLVDNALKYSPSPEPVSVEWASESGRMAIRVQDRGMGIPVDERRAVFEKFVRGRGALEANVRGTGVGLAMVRQIVTAHGGEVQLETEVGKGSTFTMLLPQVQKR